MHSSVQIYKNGTVSFGGSLGKGYPYIKGFDTPQPIPSEAQIDFFVNPSNRQFSKRRDHIMNLLEESGSDGVEGFNLRNMVVMTWSNVMFCNQVMQTRVHTLS